MIALTLAWLTLNAAAPLAYGPAASLTPAAIAPQFQSRGRGWRRGGTDAPQAGPPAAADQVVPYGSDPRQAVDFYAAPAGASRPPLAIFIHGGGWRIGDRSRVAQKPAWFRFHGWAFASLGYRLLPDAPVETQARDIADAIRALRRDAARLGFDPDRILLFGHSAGAHLAALVSTDESLLGAELEAIRATILLDGAGYDVPRQMADARFLARRIYEPAFGTDPVRQRALSPITYAGGGDVGEWLIIHSSGRADSASQSNAFGMALRRAGASVEVQPMNASHMEINRDFGTAGYTANASIAALMRRVEGS